MSTKEARSRVSADPRCWYCKIQTEAETGYRGDAPELGLPTGSGVVVCTPGCPERPDGARIWKRNESFVGASGR